jgi:hypothetical protein
LRALYYVLIIAMDGSLSDSIDAICLQRARDDYNKTKEMLDTAVNSKIYKLVKRQIEPSSTADVKLKPVKRLAPIRVPPTPSADALKKPPKRITRSRPVYEYVSVLESAIIERQRDGGYRVTENFKQLKKKFDSSEPATAEDGKRTDTAAILNSAIEQSKVKSGRSVETCGFIVQKTGVLPAP